MNSLGAQRQKAFTIVELIVVITVIAILATISVVSYGAWRKSTQSASVKSDLNAAAQAMESVKNFGTGYPLTIPTTFTPSKDNVLEGGGSVDGTSFCIDGKTTQDTSILFYIDSIIKEQGAQPGTCAARTNVPVPDVPTGVIISSVAETQLGLSWTQAAYAATYLVQCSTDPVFVSNVSSGSTLEDSLTKTVGPLSLTTEYYCRVRAVNPVGQSAWSTTVKGKTGSPNVVSKVWSNKHATSYALKFDGSLWAWGRNNYGQVGNNTTDEQATPVKVITSGVTDVAIGQYNAYAIKSDGSLWAWGRNNNGQIGNSTTTTQTTPVKVVNSGVVEVVAGTYSVYIRKTDGSLWAWGNNSNGQIGNNSTSNQTSPFQVIANSVAEIDTTTYSTYVRKIDGSVWAWGYSNNGQVGNNSTANQLTPAQVIASGTSEIIADRAGTGPIYARKSDGSLWAWGANTYGQVGNNSTSNQLTPVQVITSGVSEVAPMGLGVYVRKTDGSLWAWGYNASGQVGNNSTSNQLTPVQVIASGVSQIAPTATDVVYVRKTDNTVWAWGNNNTYGQVGNNSTANQLTPIQVITDAEKLYSSYNGYAAYVIKTDGSLWAWGRNAEGQVGNNNGLAYQRTPVQIVETDAADMVVAEYTAYLRKTDGKLYVWGNNFYGQVGGGTKPYQSTPILAL